jgi:hypothetical protein
MTCVRTAWLALDGNTVSLEDATRGYFCSSLDLGAPTVRDVMNNRPDQDGADDRTQYLGSRAVTADITALAGAGAQIDAVPGLFAPFMAPNTRPILHYVLDRPGAPERVLTVRPEAFAWAIVGDNQRDIQLQFVAADPIARDPTQRSATAWAGSSTGGGRSYPLTFPRAYGAGGVAMVGIIHSNGDLPVRPLLRIYGPIGGATVHLTPPSGVPFVVAFLAGFTIAAGAWVDVDTIAHTAYYNGDPTQNMLAQIDWTQMAWPVLPAGVDNTFTLAGAGTTGVSQVQAFWTDGYYV